MLDRISQGSNSNQGSDTDRHGRISEGDRQRLRDLARCVADVAALPIQAERTRLWQALNQRRPERAMVLAQTGNLLRESDLQCQKPMCRVWESALLTKLRRHELIHDDYPCTDLLDVSYVIEVGDYGVKEGRIYGEVENFGAYKVDPVINNPEDFDKLRPRQISVDHEATNSRLETATEILGDILQVRKRGETLCRNMLTRKLIHLRGYEQFYLDMYDHPEFLHQMMEFLRDETLREWEIYEKEGVLTANLGPEDIRGTGGLSYAETLAPPDSDGSVRMQDMVCFGESQESIGVSPELFHEFVLQYQLPLMNRFAAVDYGCCEPMDSGYELLFENIPRLSSVSVHPWGDREEAAQKLADKYVYAYKPHPSPVELPEPDYESAEQELRRTLEIAKGCCVSVTMKADSVKADSLDRASRWCEIAQRVVAEAVS